jgi:hypothetical protein
VTEYYSGSHIFFTDRNVILKPDDSIFLGCRACDQVWKKVWDSFYSDPSIAAIRINFVMKVSNLDNKVFRMKPFLPSV